LKQEYQMALSLEPRLLQQSSLSLVNEDGGTAVVDMSAVLVPVSRTRASVMFVDSRARAVYGQVYVDDYDRDGSVDRFASDVMAAIGEAYQKEAAVAIGKGRSLPPAAETLRKIKAVIGWKVLGVHGKS